MQGFNINKTVNPKGLKKDEYDAIIIGAGIGGLVCGCYLAKAGLKVLIVEKNDKVGGYCTSFEREGFKFDVGIHSIVSCGANGLMRRILNGLDINDLEFNRLGLANVIITPTHAIDFSNDINHTVENLQSKFPREEKNITDFFNFIKKCTPVSAYAQYKNKTFDFILGQYFKNKKLKTILSVLVQNIGLPPSRASAVATLMLYKEHLLDGGYYPKGGMQNFSEIICDKYKNYGGRLILSEKVKGIKIENKKSIGIISKENVFIKSKYVISNCDMEQTVLELIGKNFFPLNFIKKMKNMEPSLSAFVVCLGLKCKFNNIMPNANAFWHLESNNIEQTYKDVFNAKIEKSKTTILCCFPSFHDSSMAPFGRENLFILTLLPFKEKHFWDTEKDNITNHLLESAGQIIPTLRKNIMFYNVLTPDTFYKYTLNSKGAIRGWAATPRQSKKEVLGVNLNIKNLFFCGHWVSSSIGQGGINMVSYSGWNVARSILIKEKRWVKPKAAR